MALEDAGSFIFGGNTGLSYEQLKQRRAIAQALASRQGGFPKNRGEGLTYSGAEHWRSVVGLGIATARGRGFKTQRRVTQRCRGAGNNLHTDRAGTAGEDAACYERGTAGGTAASDDQRQW